MRMRKKRRGKERLAVLSALTLENPAQYRDSGAYPFAEQRPLRLEIGCGKGDFICSLSKRDADYNYFAMERVEDVAVIAMEKYAVSRNLGARDPHGGWRTPEGELYRDVRWDIPLEKRGNVRFLPQDAKNLSEIFADGIFETIYANFSDPWTKNGQASRRLTHPDYLAQYWKLLAHGGAFRFKTDNPELFAYSVEMLEASPFTITCMTEDLHASEWAADNIETEYERNFSSQGIPIRFVEGRKL